MTLIEALERENLKPEIPDFSVGDTVKVHNKIVEGTRERIQVFEGIIIKIFGFEVFNNTNPHIDH